MQRLIMRAVGALAALAFVVASAGASAETCQSHPYTIQRPAGYHHDKWVKGGQESGDIRIEYDGFTAVFDGPDDDDGDPSTPNLLAQPQWVSHEVRRYVRDGMFQYPDGFKRPSRWYEIDEIAFVAEQPGVTSRRLHDSYAGEALIWNRGHMATRSLVNRISPEAGCNTHNFANAVPQYWSMNQGEWNALERYTGAVANKYGNAWAVNGPIFYKGQPVETIGGNGEVKISIPHALFKVIIFEVDDDIYVRAFVFPQPSYEKVKAIMAATSAKRAPAMGYRLCNHTDQLQYDFAPYSSSLSEIERLTGITFFHDASPSQKSVLNAYSSRPLSKIELRYFDRPCGEAPKE